MRIISPFRDFYDSVQKFGQDQTIVYKRIPHTTDAPRDSNGRCVFPVMGYGRWSSRRALDVASSTVGFCGQVYPAVKLTVTEQVRLSAMKPPSCVCYSTDQVARFVYKHLSAEWCKKFQKTTRGRFGEFIQREFDEYFAEGVALGDKFLQLFMDAKSAQFVTPWSQERGTQIVWDACLNEIVWDACLNELEFYRVVDPYSAFTQVESFVSNMARPIKPIPEIDDKTMAEAKGFDKYSFRKAPSKKR